MNRSSIQFPALPILSRIFGHFLSRSNNGFVSENVLKPTKLYDKSLHPNTPVHLPSAVLGLGRADLISSSGEANSLRFWMCRFIALCSSVLLWLALVNACLHFSNSALISSNMTGIRLLPYFSYVYKQTYKLITLFLQYPNYHNFLGF